MNMSATDGAVLLDIDDGAALITQSGYRINDLVVTVATPILNGLLRGKHAEIIKDNEKLLSRLNSCKLTCYFMNGSILEEKKCVASKIWFSEAINRITKNMGKYNLSPYRNGTKFITDYTQSFLICRLSSDGVVQMDALTKLSNSSKDLKVSHGQDAYTVYTPFGANEFMNSCSRGCLSKEIGGCLYLLDGRLTPGCEGAPVFTSGKKDDQIIPIGLVLFPIALGLDHSSYSLVAPMHVVLESLFDSTANRKEDPRIGKSSLVSMTPPMSHRSLQDTVENVLVVKTSYGWGSGVAVGPGLMITNAHVVGYDSKDFWPVNVCWKNSTTPAHVVFSSSKSSLLDLALLRYNKHFGPPGFQISRSTPTKGEKVIAVGHPLQTYDNVPSISKGAVLNYWDKSAGFSTSCIISSGSSGGSIVREDGTLLGIVVGLVKADNGPYPEINICITAAIFEEAVRTVQATGETAQLRKLVTYDDPWLRALLNRPQCKY